MDGAHALPPAPSNALKQCGGSVERFGSKRQKYRAVKARNRRKIVVMGTNDKWNKIETRASSSTTHRRVNAWTVFGRMRGCWWALYVFFSNICSVFKGIWVTFVRTGIGEDDLCVWT